MNDVMIGNRKLDAFGDPLVIAEIGVNHDGSVQRALELVKIAADCGADAVKLQIFKASVLMNGASSLAEYQKARCEDADAIAMLQRYELGSSDLRVIAESIRRHKMLAIATPFSLSDVGTAAALDLAAVKIASPDLVNRPLIQQAASLRRPMLISTGAANADEITQTVQWLREWNSPSVLMHCISSYPTPEAHANLAWIAELATQHQTLVGYSDHTTGILSGALAVMAGACVIERHLTYDQAAVGPDHAASSDPKQFAKYVQLIRQAAKLRGRPGKTVLAIEQDVRKVSRQSLVASRDLIPQRTLTENDVMIQRPGTGIPAAEFHRAIGKRPVRPIARGTLLNWDMLADAA